MKRLFWTLFINLLFNATYCHAGNPPAQIKLCPQQKQQLIDGFGVSEAGWADELFQHHKKAEVMDMLYGKDGLRLSILRGEVFPQSPADTANDYLKRAGQVWLTRYAREVCNVDKLIFSTWSPPAYMKSNGKASHGFLKPEYYQNYANYLVNFCKAYEEAGMKIYAISPSNEPGYEAPWNSCKWNPNEMGRFLTENLAPTMKKQCPGIKIIYGENPTWSTPQNPMLQFIASEKFVNDILDNYPEVNGDLYIASGHGYDIPLSDYFKDAKDIATPIIPYTKAIERGQQVWVTEISSIDPLDTSMENGLKWAANFHAYLADANANAYIWWCGAMPTTNNESLIVLNKDRENYSFTKRYDTFGNYTRYIPVGSHRIQTENKGLPKEVLVSAFCKDNQYTTVIVNPTKEKITCQINLGTSRVSGNVKTYTTTKDKRWEENNILPKGKNYKVILEPQSVTTLVGSIN